MAMLDGALALFCVDMPRAYEDHNALALRIRYRSE